MSNQSAFDMNLVNFRYSEKHTPNSMTGDSIQVLTIGNEAGTHKLSIEFSGNRTTANESKINGSADICLFSIMADVSEATRSSKLIKIDTKSVAGENTEIAGRISLNRYTWGAAQLKSQQSVVMTP